MPVSLTIPARVPQGLLPLDDEAAARADEQLHRLLGSYLYIAASNRLKARDTKANPRWAHAAELVRIGLTDNGIRLSLASDGGDDDVHARQVLDWLELAWASVWTQHPYVTDFARPVPPLDVTVTLDPVEVARRHQAGTDGFSRWAPPRIEKWGKTRKGLSELYRRIGEDQDVVAGGVLPLITGCTLPSGWKRPKKTDTLTAAEAKRWLALNPRRAF